MDRSQLTKQPFQGFPLEATDSRRRRRRRKTLLDLFAGWGGGEGRRRRGPSPRPRRRARRETLCARHRNVSQDSSSRGETVLSSPRHQR
ncbi:hypothetical protein CABS03_05950 [Colletotrichum abscissum]|uniref:Uncharacterized protein n=1 Tax=Colletotrichum abscissum TaxID=1671311 RepID=A0A9P9XHG3_9PEZI|nr:hypothetical protein CABS02_06340 [Colletotrichum abscissum]